MDNSFGSNILHDHHMNSAAFPGGAYVRTPQSSQQVPRFIQQPALNPSMPVFQPISFGGQRYEAVAERTPPHTPTNKVLQQRYVGPPGGQVMVMDNNVRVSAAGLEGVGYPRDMAVQRYVQTKHDLEMANVELLARKNEQELQDMRMAVGMDLRTLQAQLAELRVRIDGRDGTESQQQLDLRPGQTGVDAQSGGQECKVEELVGEPTESEPTSDPQCKDADLQAVVPAAQAVPMPLGVRKMPEPPELDLVDYVETFTWEFLTLNLGGHQWSPGYYFGATILPSKAFWVLEGEYEPFLPTGPGRHGAKLTALFNMTETGEGEAPTEENYLNTPVFVRAEGSEEYRYYGNYSQLRFSDRLDYDSVMEVPLKVRQYWAEQLADPGRPGWVTKALTEHFWPRPTYDGPIPTDEALATPATAETTVTGTSAILEKRVATALRQYATELAIWERDTAVSVNFLNSATLLKMFEEPDAEEKPGLRLWYEYLQCVGFDHKFYDFLVKMKGFPLPVVEASNIEKSRKLIAAPTNTVQDRAVVETTPTAAVPIRTEKAAAPALAAVLKSGYVPPHLRGQKANISKPASSPAVPVESPWVKVERDLRVKWEEAVPDQAWDAAAPWEVEAGGGGGGGEDSGPKPLTVAEQLEAAKAFQKSATKAGDRGMRGSRK